MKKQILYIFSLVILANIFSSCEKELQVYNEGDCALNFYYSDGLLSGNFTEDMAESSYSFVYAGSAVKVDTVWFKVRTMGFVYDTPRAFEIEQVEVEGAKNAVAGKHYVAFNDPSLAKHFQIEANTSYGEFPIVMLRDASLADGDVVLKFRIKPNSNFVSGYDVFQTRTLTISASLSRPASWTEKAPLYVSYNLGEWGPVKHQWFIEVTGERWDDDYIKGLFTGDSGYLSFLLTKLKKLLNEENERRKAQGLDVLKEADGSPVTFDY